MSNIKVDLSQYPNRFADDSLSIEFSETKPNFVFGKNGTGKTTIADAIVEQFSDIFNVKVFKDFDGVTENGKLNAIALGTENAEIQKQINELDRKLEELKSQIIPIDGIENLYSKFQNTKKAYDKQQKKIDGFFTKSAREITASQRLGRSYNKNSFEKDIEGEPRILSEEEIEKHRKIIKEDKKSIIGVYCIPDLDGRSILRAVNDIIALKVVPSEKIPELDNSPERQKFAKEGVRIHKVGEKCTFCGGEITKSRWDKLASYFNDEVAKIEVRIAKGLKFIDEKLNNLDNIRILDKDQFYAINNETVKLINKEIKALIKDRRLFLQSLANVLNEKRNNLFVSMAPTTVSLPIDIEQLQDDINCVIKANNNLTNDLEKNKKFSADSLRLHEVSQKIATFGYVEEDKKLAALKANLDNAESDLEKIKKEIVKESKHRKELIMRTKDEGKIAERINELLAKNGIESFSLVLADNEEQQRGQYRIAGYDGTIRDVTNLSKGEKNIIGFMYFILSLKETTDDRRRKIIVFDDPMTSNDDIMQYLMADMLQGLYSNINDDIFILLTHNSFFYLQVRKRAGKGRAYKDYMNYFLSSKDNKHTTIKKIEKGDDDVTFGYGTSWKDLREAYANNLPDSMIIHCRKILENYIEFNNLDKKGFFKNNSIAERMFNVNSHSIETSDYETNGRTRGAILRIFKEVFKANSAEEHFNSHWNI